MTFEQWYRHEHAPLVRALTIACAGDAELAQEAASEAFARALERWDRVGAMDSPGGWVYRVAVNLVRRRWRRASLERALAQRGLDRSVPAPHEPEPELWAAVAALPERTRMAIALRYVADLTEPEIARTLGVKPGTASALLHQGRRKLAVALATPEDRALVTEDAR